jgi:MFS family permease
MVSANRTSPASISPAPHDPYAALRLTDFRWYLSGNLPYLVGLNMQTAAVSWEVYERTESTLALAMVGFVQIVPVIGLFLPAGHVIDRVSRRLVLVLSLSSGALWSAGLGWCSASGAHVGWVYLFLLLTGVARTFIQPARAAFLPQIVPREVFSNAVTWNSSGFQLATMIGPALAGGAIAWLGGATSIYVATSALALLNCVCLSMIKSPPFVPALEPASLASLAAGLAFVWRTKVMLAAITLDMFAVLLGGATALLSVYARDILEVGPNGFGWMRAAPGLGAVVMSILVAHRPPFERAGRALLLSVVGFGVATIVFGLSRSFPLSLAMLFSLGALDMISVVVRHTLVQILTPDEMRGRVSAVNSLFIGLSNELGEAESGLVAYLFQRGGDRSFGPTVSVVSGGLGTLVVVAVVAAIWPQLRRYGRLDGK